MGFEIERRFLVLNFEPNAISRTAHQDIRQGYFEHPNPLQHLRVRIVNNSEGTLTWKEGSGIIRREKERNIPLETAQWLLSAAWHHLQKRRHFIEGWEIDIFGDPLTGLVLAEREIKSIEEQIFFPSCIIGALEVTDSLTNLHLARLATQLRQNQGNVSLSIPEIILGRLLKKVPKIVVTGGPCAGKSALMSSLKTKRPDIHCVPETATILISQVGLKPNPDNPLSYQRFQETVYRTQRLFETTSVEQALEQCRKAVVFDRGTMDNAAYLKGGVTEFESLCKTRRDYEYSQYNLVLCLELPSSGVFELNRANNPARHETYGEALALQERIKEVWSGHPKFVLVKDEPTWNKKERKALSIIDDFIGV